MARKSTIDDKLKRVKIALIFIFISLVERIIFDVLLALNNFKLLKEIIELIFTGQITAEDPVAAVAEFVLFLIIFGILFAVFLIPTIVWLIYYIQTLVNASSDKKNKCYRPSFNRFSFSNIWNSRFIHLLKSLKYN